MRIPFFLCLFFLFSCSLSNDSNEVMENDFSFLEQNMDTNPPKPIKCEYPFMDCGLRKCVNVEYDNKNCGWCNNICEISYGEFCMNYHCVDVRDYGYNIYPRGPVEYNIKKDLPRPPNVLNNLNR